VLTFLESVGRRSEAEFYVRLFASLPKQSFALILTPPRVVETALGSLVEQLRFLADLGLRAPVVLGAFTRRSGGHAAERLREALPGAGLMPWVVRLETPALGELVTRAVAGEKVPLVVASGDLRLERVGALARDLATRKLVVLRARGGLGPHEERRLELDPGHYLEAHAGGISVINLRSDLEALERARLLDQPDAELLGAVQRLLEAAGTPRTTLSVTAPMSLLNELFTVRGAGTLVKPGSRILKSDSDESVDVSRVRALLEASFGRQLAQDFFSRPALTVYFEESYRGAAIVQSSPLGPLLSKFAVEPVARGEGIGQDLWRAMLKDCTSLFWRARANNPIRDWYMSVCDGFTHAQEWSVYWRGIDTRQIPAVIEHALALPRDFS
jgi:acetylglutamate kinase